MIRDEYLADYRPLNTRLVKARPEAEGFSAVWRSSMDLKKMLRGVNPQIETIEEAREKFKNIKYKNTDDHKRANEIMARWNELYLPDLEVAIASNDLDIFLKAVFSPDMPQRGPAYNLACKHFPEMLSQISSLDQANTLYRANGGYHDDNFAIWLKSKFNEFCLIELEKTETFDALEALAKVTLTEEQPFEPVVGKWAEACATPEEIEKVKNFINERYSGRSYLGSALKSKVNRKIESILFAEIPKANDIGTIIYFYSLAPEGAAELLAFEKWLMLCQTAEQANEAFRVLPKTKVACINAAYNKVRELTGIKSQ
jgi:hypothetical protein